MKTLTLTLTLTILLFTLSSCFEDAGTLKRLDRGANENIEVYKYYYGTGEAVYIARFKDKPNVVTTTWHVYNPATKVVQSKSSVVVFENDSIQIIMQEK